MERTCFLPKQNPEQSCIYRPATPNAIANPITPYVFVNKNAEVIPSMAETIAAVRGVTVSCNAKKALDKIYTQDCGINVRAKNARVSAAKIVAFQSNAPAPTTSLTICARSKRNAIVAGIIKNKSCRMLDAKTV